MPALHQDIDTNLSRDRARGAGEGSNVQGLFEEAVPFIQQLNSATEIESPTDIEDSAFALERLSELCDTVASYSSDSVKEIVLKVALYRAMAPEAAQHQSSWTIDERLLNSIMSDIEKLS